MQTIANVLLSAKVTLNQALAQCRADNPNATFEDCVDAVTASACAEGLTVTYTLVYTGVNRSACAGCGQHSSPAASVARLVFDHGDRVGYDLLDATPAIDLCVCNSGLESLID